MKVKGLILLLAIALSGCSHFGFKDSANNETQQASEQDAPKTAAEKAEAKRLAEKQRRERLYRNSAQENSKFHYQLDK